MENKNKNQNQKNEINKQNETSIRSVKKNEFVARNSRGVRSQLGDFAKGELRSGGRIVTNMVKTEIFSVDGMDTARNASAIPAVAATSITLHTFKRLEGRSDFVLKEKYGLNVEQAMDHISTLNKEIRDLGGQSVSGNLKLDMSGKKEYFSKANLTTGYKKAKELARLNRHNPELSKRYKELADMYKAQKNNPLMNKERRRKRKRLKQRRRRAIVSPLRRNFQSVDGVGNVIAIAHVVRICKTTLRHSATTVKRVVLMPVKMRNWVEHRRYVSRLKWLRKNADSNKLKTQKKALQKGMRNEKHKERVLKRQNKLERRASLKHKYNPFARFRDWRAKKGLNWRTRFREWNPLRRGKNAVKRKVKNALKKAAINVWKGLASLGAKLLAALGSNPVGWIILLVIIVIFLIIVIIMVIFSNISSSKNVTQDIPYVKREVILRTLDEAADAVEEDSHNIEQDFDRVAKRQEVYVGKRSTKDRLPHNYAAVISYVQEYYGGDLSNIDDSEIEGMVQNVFYSSNIVTSKTLGTTTEKVKVSHRNPKTGKKETKYESRKYRKGCVVWTSYGVEKLAGINISSTIQGSQNAAPMTRGSSITIPKVYQGVILGTAATLENMPRNWGGPSTSQHKVQDVWEKKGKKFDKNGYATVYGRYIVAMTSTFGDIGDYVDIEFKKGNKTKTLSFVIGDHKSQQYTSYDHNPANKWGHQKGAVILEFWARRESEGGRKADALAALKIPNPNGTGWRPVKAYRGLENVLTSKLDANGKLIKASAKKAKKRIK